MKWSIDELTDIRALVGGLLDDIGLRSYIFNVEQDENDWIISVDFPRHDDEWQAVDLRIEKETLRDCLTHPEARKSIGSAWRNRLDRLG